MKLKSFNVVRTYTLFFLKKSFITAQSLLKKSKAMG